jgi:ElaB/YqjD/DUF883 family membrane-anchored ribosome-binding protein
MSTYNPTSEEIKADIERTRNNVSEKIDTIQERLSPENLKHQAQETMQGFVNESTDRVVGYFNEQVQQLPTMLVNSLKHNPIPAALIGVGIGWLLLESTNAKRHEDRYPGGAERYVGSARSYGGYQPSQYETYGKPNEYTGAPYYVDPYSEQGAYYGQSHADDGKGILGQAREKMGEVGEQVRDTVQDAAQQVSHRASQVGDQVRHQFSSLEAETSERAAHLQSSTQHQTQRMGQQAQRMGQQMQHVVETNPLVVGAVVFAVGTAVALALPTTRRESQLMGEMRDRVLDNAGQMAGEVADKIQHVTEEIKPKLAETAQRVRDEVQQTGKEAADEVAHTFKGATETVKQETTDTLQDTMHQVQDKSATSKHQGQM